MSQLRDIVQLVTNCNRSWNVCATYCEATSITKLDISACRKIGDDGIMGIAERMTN